jgi:hypothetical protein
MFIEAFDNDPRNIEMYRRNGVKATLITGDDSWKGYIQRGLNDIEYFTRF